MNAIRSRSDLLRFMYRPALVPREGTISVDIPGLDAARKSRLQAAVDKDLESCGCEEGAVGLIGGGLFVVWISWMRHVDLISWKSVILTIGAAIVGAVVGKALGIVRARVRLRRIIQREIGDLSTAGTGRPTE